MKVVILHEICWSTEILNEVFLIIEKEKQVGSLKPQRLSTKKINQGRKRPHMFAVPVLSS